MGIRIRPRGRWRLEIGFGLLGWMFFSAPMLFGNPTSVMPESAAMQAEAFSRANEPSIRAAWLQRIDKNGGVHSWTRRHAGMLVFQEWTALLSEHRNSDPVQKRAIGRRLEKYVVDGNIGALGEVGTSLPVPGYDQGDFDMVLLGCISLLGLFEDDRLLLTDATFTHLIRHVVGLWGQTPKTDFDLFFFSLPETENHLFMTESARYLTNSFIQRNARNLPSLEVLKASLTHAGVNLRNDNGTLHRLLMRVMHQIMGNGFFEFNAQIYQRFTLHALANVYSFADDAALRTAAGSLLDYVSAVFAFQSMDFIRYPPYRRSSEKFRDSTLIDSDATCSFFAAQGSDSDVKAYFVDLWNRHSAHASMALWSTHLKYRVPDALMDYMRGKRGDYQAESILRYRARRHWKSTTQRYFSSPNFLLTAGGKYQAYEGRNFPTYQVGFQEAPWVYDIVSRSSTAMIRPRESRPRLLSDILHFRGRQWRDNNLALHGNFAYGYARVPEPRSAWPQSIPEGWSPVYVDTTRDFDFRFYDLSHRGVYVVLGRLKAGDGLWRRWTEKYARGTIEIVDAERAGSLANLRAAILDGQKSGKEEDRFQYRTFGGALIQLNRRYGPRFHGFEKVSSREAQEDLPPLTLLPFRFPWVELPPPAHTDKRLYPLVWPEPGSEYLAKPLVVTQTHPRRELVAYSDGMGNLFVNNPSLGQSLVINFTLWWKPTRQVLLIPGLDADHPGRDWEGSVPAESGPPR